MNQFTAWYSKQVKTCYGHVHNRALSTFPIPAAPGAGAYDEAQQLAAESLQLSQLNQDASATAHAYNLLAVIAQYREQSAEAIDWFHKSLALYREIGDHWSVARILVHLGAAAAEAHYREALATALDVYVLPQALDALAGLADVALHYDAADRALLLARGVAAYAHAGLQARAGRIIQAAAHRACAPAAALPFETLVAAALQAEPRGAGATQA